MCVRIFVYLHVHVGAWVCSNGVHTACDARGPANAHVCACLCICASVCACLCVCMYVSGNDFTSALLLLSLQEGLQACVCLHVYCTVCVRARAHVCKCVCVCLRTYVLLFMYA